MTGFCEHGHETTGSVQEGRFLKHWTTFQGRFFIVKFHKIRVYGPKFQRQIIIEGCVTHVTQHIAVVTSKTWHSPGNVQQLTPVAAQPSKPAAKCLPERNITSLEKLPKAEFHRNMAPETLKSVRNTSSFQAFHSEPAPLFLEENNWSRMITFDC